MAGGRRYTDTERGQALAALAANGGNLKRTARELGMPVPTLRKWSTGERRPNARADSEPQKKDMALALERIAWKLVRAIPDKIEGANLSASFIALGIAVDKMRILRDQPTAISEERGGGSDLDLERLTSEQLDQFIALCEAARRGERPLDPGTEKPLAIYGVDEAGLPDRKATPDTRPLPRLASVGPD